MRNLIFGGTFDPVHIGHLHLADIVWRMFDRPRLLFVPSGIPPHKDGEGISAREHRIRMLEKTLESTPWELELSEVRKSGTTYTIDTVRELKKRYEWTENPGFILGDDLVSGFSSWKEPDALASEAVLLLASRIDGPSRQTDFNYPHIPIGNTILPVSSSEIREAAGNGGAFKNLVPEEVYQYIVVNRLYGYGNGNYY